MSITSAMYSGVSGLLANAEGINVIGNNLANVNTVGFKSGRLLFSDMLSADGPNNSQIGRGVQIQKVDNIYAQGAFENTEIVSDIALQGNSFFAFAAPNSTAAVATQDLAYLSRAGALRVNSSYNLVNPDGYVALESAGGEPILLPHTEVLATDTITFGAVTAGQTVIIGDKTFTDGGAGSTAAQVAAYFALPANLPTGYTLAYNGSADTPPTLGFTLDAGTTTDLTVSGTGAAAQQIEVAKANAGFFQKITAIDSQGVITYSDVNGDTYYYNGNGGAVLTATTTNYATALANGTIAVVNPTNPLGLIKVGGTLFESSADCGIPSTAFTVETNRANGSSEKMYSNSLEQSNVDMAAQFVKMILTQRAYSANSKTITTADEMTQEVLNLKR
jgi:flagellar hook protein FlgE